MYGRTSGESYLSRPYPHIVDKVDGLHQVGVEDEDEVLLQQGHVPLVLPSSKVKLLVILKKVDSVKNTVTKWGKLFSSA
jgi:hypothetical protein